MKIDVPTLYDLFNKWEQKYPVDKWTLEEVHIWPILKVIIYFNLFRESKVKKLGYHKPTGPKQILRKIWKGLYAYYHLYFFKFKKSDYLFSGAPSHRVNWEGKQFNRYFDPIIDYLKLKGESPYLFEYSKIDLRTVYNSKRVINLIDLLPAFGIKNKSKRSYNHFDQLSNFSLFLKEVESETGIKGRFLEIAILKRVDSVLHWARLFEFLINKTQAKFTFGLCYYSNAMYGLNFASNKLGIRSFDMQHGLQGFLHPAYFFNKVPFKGFNVLPEYFWVWEYSSYKNINNWTYDSIHKTILGGNPWIEYINANKSLNMIKTVNKPMILYTLQPLKPMLPDYLIEVIKSTCEKYSWWLRLHPRMTKLEIAEIEKILYKNNIQEHINIKQASNSPLPFLLNNCQLHISGSSGSIAEAAMMQTPSLIIDELGVNSFKDLIESKEAVACLTKDPVEIIEIIENILNNPEMQIGNQAQGPTGYKTIIDEYIKKT